MFAGLRAKWPGFVFNSSGQALPPSLNEYTKSAKKVFFLSYSSLNENVIFLETVIFVKAEGFIGKRSLYLMKYPGALIKFSFHRQ